MEPNASNQYPMQPRKIAEQEKNEPLIDVVEVFYLFWGNLGKILVCCLLGLLVAFAYTYMQSRKAVPQYTATTSVYVASASGDPIDLVKILPDLPSSESLLTDVVDAVEKLQNPPSDASLIADYKELLFSRPLLQDVVDDLSLDMEYTALADMIEIGDTEDTHVVKVLVTSDDAQMSADIANDLVKQAAVYYQKFVKMDPPDLIEEAVAPTQVSNQASPGYLINTMLGGVVGAVLCCCVLFVLYVVDDTFIIPDDFVDRYGVQPLAVVPDEKLSEDGSTKK